MHNPRIGVLPGAAQAQISAAIGEDEPTYHAIAQPRGFRVNNASHAVSAEFTRKGVEFFHGANRWGMALRGYGHGGKLRIADAPAPTAKANRVEYRRAGLTEWYVNGPLGLEQGFTLERVPASSNGEPLTLTFALSGNLTASVLPEARGLTLNTDGAAALRYAGLAAWDAHGRELRAWLEIAGHELRVRVDDAGAQYPVTIDPYVQAVKLTSAIPCTSGGVCDDGETSDEFGHSIGISADASTLVVGVPFKLTNGVMTGAAYVFVKPSDQLGGWNSPTTIFYKTKLLASDGATAGLLLGKSVAISNDGETIVVGAVGFASIGPNGAAYVFVRPAAGWGSTSVRTQTARLTQSDGAFYNSFGSFGTAVTISGDGATIAVGAPYQMDAQFANYDSGAMYVFLRPSSGWIDSTEHQKNPGPTHSQFGRSVSLSGDGKTLVVGAIELNQYTGYADVFVRQYISEIFPDGFVAHTRLLASDGVSNDFLGYSVSTNGDGSTIVVGAPTSASFTTSAREGMAYVFERPTAGWPVYSLMSETAKLTASDRQAGDSFGISVGTSRDGSTIVAGASQVPLYSGPSNGPGALYVFGKPESGWSTATESIKLLASDALPGNGFGSSTSVNGNGTVLVGGAPSATIGSHVVQGAAYAFTGSVATPFASVSPSSLTFGAQSVGTTSSPQTVTVMNSGTAALHVSSVSASGPFISTQNCISASPIAPGGSCSENVAFAPLSVGTQYGILTFTDDSGGTGGATQQVQLQGDAQKAGTSTTITSILGNLVFAGQSVIVYFSVAPEPGDTLTPFGTVTVAASTGEGCGGGVVLGSCILSFSTTGDRTITATYNGNLNFNPSTSASSLVRVVDFSLSASPSSQTISGRKASYSLTVAAVDGFTGTVSLGCTGGPPNTTCAVSPKSINVTGASATTKATLTLPVGATSGTYTITFTGSVGGIDRSTTATLTVK